ncbi:MAG: hypothetical protein IPL96_02450 [Holophagaceae bacterium]|nr:hypothetical protein [Holophagaceae bacterium]
MRPGALPALGAACSAILSAQSPSQDRGLQTWSLQQGRVTAGEGASAAPLAAGSLQKPFVAKAWAATHPGAATPRFTCGPGSACWRPGGHGELGLARALAVSCNTYFRALAAVTPPAALARTFAEEGFQGAPTTPDLAVGLVEPEGAITITPGELVEAYGRLVREPWSVGEPVRREVLAGLREAARSGTAGALGQRGWWAKTGTVPAADGDPTRTAGLLIAADDAGFVLLGRLEPGTGREAAAALAPMLARLRPWQAPRPGPAQPPAGPGRGVPASGREVVEGDTVRVRLLDLLGSRHIEVANLGAFPIPAGRGYLGPGASAPSIPATASGRGCWSSALRTWASRDASRDGWRRAARPGAP